MNRRKSGRIVLAIVAGCVIAVVLGACGEKTGPSTEVLAALDNDKLEIGVRGGTSFDGRFVQAKPDADFVVEAAGKSAEKPEDAKPDLNPARFEATALFAKPGLDFKRADAQSGISFRPAKMPARFGKGVSHGRSVVYQADDDNIAIVVTPVPDGIKEDIVLARPAGDSLTFEWDLKLGEGLEARKDPLGNINIYGPSQYLWGNISIGDDKSRDLIEKARKNAAKDQILYAIPAPVIRDATGRPTADGVRYELNGTQIALKADRLAEREYPVSIDPTVLVSSGLIDAWKNAPLLNQGRWGHATVASQGYLYVIGGFIPSGGGYWTVTDTVEYASVFETGEVGTWSYTSSLLNGGRGGLTAVVDLDGAIFALGGTSGTTTYSDVQWAVPNADGSLTSWTNTSAFAVPRSFHASVLCHTAVNGLVVYVIGGQDLNGGYLGSVEVGWVSAGNGISWHYTEPLATARAFHSAAAYNSFIYVSGGYNGSGALNSVEKAQIIDFIGDVYEWTVEAYVPGALYLHTSQAFNGHLYVVGGRTDSNATTTAVFTTVINPDGTLSGDWQRKSGLLLGAEGLSSAYYNGHLYVTGGNGDTGSLRSASYARLLPVTNIVESWNTISAFTNGRTGHATVAINGYVYLIGGCSGGLWGCTTWYNDVQYARINADGTLGSWSSTTSFNGSGLSEHTAVAWQGPNSAYMYVIGGFNGSAATDHVQYAPINPNGTLGNWQDTVSLLNRRMSHSSNVYQGDPSFIYAIGGYDGTATKDTGYVAKIANDTGALDSTFRWQNLASLGSYPVEEHASVISGGRLYVIGGCKRAQGICEPKGNVRHSGTINATDGSAVISNDDIGLPTERFGHTATVTDDGYVFVAGGLNWNLTKDVVYTKIGDDGYIGAWSESTSLASANYGHATVNYNGYLYNTGGWLYSNEVRYSALNTHGAIYNWGAGPSLNLARLVHCSTAYNGHLYVLGGQTPGGFTTTVEIADVSPSGMLSPWRTSGYTFTNGRGFLTCAAANGYLYLVGGTNGGTVFDDVQRAPILTDGSGNLAGAWATDSYHLTEARYWHAGAVYNSKLYVIGGAGGSGAISTVEWAPIGPSGSLEADWSYTSTPFTTGRYGVGAAVTEGYLYAMGGIDSGGAPLPDVYKGQIQADGTVSGWAAVNSMPTGRYFHYTAAGNGILYALGGAGSAGYFDSVYYSRINPLDGTIGSWISTAALGNPRVHIAANIYNGNMYVSGGSTGPGVYLDSVRIGAIASDGLISGDWREAPRMPVGLSGHALVAVNERLYVVAGFDGVSYRNNVWRAPISSSGAVGAWTADTPIDSGLVYPGAVAHKGWMYIMGGHDGSNWLKTVYSTRPNKDGSITGWNRTFFNNPPRRYLSAVVASNGPVGCGDQWDRLYILGGENDGWENTTIVEYAKVDESGIYGNWTQSSYHLLEGRSRFAAAVSGNRIFSIGGYNWGAKETAERLDLNGSCEPAGTAYVTPLPSRRMNHSGVAANGHVWVFGGYDNSSNLLNDVLAAKVNSSGSLGAWQRVNRFEKAVANSPATVWNGYIVTSGGHATSGEIKNVQVLPANILPTVGDWATTTPFAVDRAMHTTVANNGYLYVIGGYGGAPVSARSDVQYAAIGPDGAVGAWTATSSLTTARVAHASVVHGDYVYAIGGSTGPDPSPYQTVEFAPVNSNGSLGTWSSTTNLQNPLCYHSAVVHRPGGSDPDRLYVLGGFNSSDVTDEISWNTFNANGTLGQSWTAVRDLPSTLYGMSAVISNNRLLVIGGVVAVADRTAAIQRAVIDPADGTLGGWTAQTAMPEPRANHSAVLYNGNIFVVGGETGTAALDDVIAAPLDAFGDVGTWRFVKRMNRTTLFHGAAQSSGNLYVTGGGSVDFYVNSVEYSPLEAP